jgi:hypothetical protein
MRHRWPEDTRFTRVVLEVEDNVNTFAKTGDEVGRLHPM